MVARSISRTTIVLVLVATFAALIARSWLQLQFLARDLAPQLAADLSYLIVPPTMALLLLPLWRSERNYLIAQFRVSHLTLNLILTSVLIGLLIRLLWWAQLVFGISFGIYTSDDPSAIVGPAFAFQCPRPALVALNLLVMSVLTPLVEELVNRAYVLASLKKRGIFPAIVISAVVFAILHNLTSIPFAFFAGLIFGWQYWKVGSLWPSLITHATINTLVLLDWRCLAGHWNPRIENLPLWLPGIVSFLLILIAAAALYRLLREQATEA